MTAKEHEVDAAFVQALIQHGLQDTLVREKILDYLGNLVESRKPVTDKWNRLYEQIYADWTFTPTKPIQTAGGRDTLFDMPVYPYVSIDYDHRKRIAVVGCWVTLENRVWMQEYEALLQSLYRTSFCCESAGDAIDQGLAHKPSIRAAWNKFQENHT